jgi:hypothetical protein
MAELVERDEVTEGLKDALGQFQKTVTIADHKSAKRGDRKTTREVTITRIRGVQFAEIFEEVGSLVQKGVVSLRDEAGKLILGQKGVLTDFRPESMITRGGKPLLNMIAIACWLDRDHVYNLDPLDIARLLGVAWRVNYDFFSQNETEFKALLGPIWTLLEDRMNKTKSSPAESSPDSSTSSSAAATEPSEK